MTHWFKIGTMIKAMLEKIFRSSILLILCTNSKSLYGWLIKLGIIEKKTVDNRYDEFTSIIQATRDYKNEMNLKKL